MIRETSAVAFRQNLGDMLNQVQYRYNSIVIKRDGKPVAALVDARLIEQIRRLQARFDGLCERIEAGYAEVPEAEGLAEHRQRQQQCDAEADLEQFLLRIQPAPARHPHAQRPRAPA